MMTFVVVDAVASRPHYWAHIEPVWAALGEHRGRLWVPPALAGRVTAAGFGQGEPGPRGDTILAASWDDVAAAHRQWKRVVLMEHGVGQTYVLDGGGHDAYAGSRTRCGAVDMFLCPNERVAQLNRGACPAAQVEVIGSPWLDRLGEVPRRPDVDVGFTWHWDCQVCPETACTFDHWASTVETLACQRRVLGHAHPRVMNRLRGRYRFAGIPVAETFDEVVARCRVVAADNTSALFFGAALGLGVVVLNHPSYRRDVHHGLRFWDAADVGVQCDDVGGLGEAVEEALDGPTARAAGIVRELFPWKGQAAMRAAWVLVGHDTSK